MILRKIGWAAIAVLGAAEMIVGPLPSETFAANSPRRKSSPVTQSDLAVVSPYTAAVAADREREQAAREQLNADRDTYGPASPQAKQSEVNLNAARSTLKLDEKILERAQPR